MSNPDSPLQLPTVEKSEIIFEKAFIKIRQDHLLIGQKTYHYYTLLTKPYAVVVLATTPDGQYILNEEYRHPTGHVLLSCAGGYMEEGETPEQAAKRELQEETGYQAQSFQFLGSSYPYAGLSAQKTIFIRAKDAYLAGMPQLETAEILRTTLKSKEEMKNMIKKGCQVDGILCAALYFDSLFNPD